MKAFMDRDFLLHTDTEKHLYHDFAKDLPIIDYHCHLSPQEIYEDKRFRNITEVWLGGDHYKWRLMRSFGVEERLITGDASDEEKFKAWAKCLGMAAGNPLFHWSHLELKNYFGYEGVLNEESAEAVWNLANEKLAEPEFSARNLIRRSKVTHLCTTDDPVDSLEWHQRIREDGFEVVVNPAFRPDKAIGIEKADYIDYMRKLERAAGLAIGSFKDLVRALKSRMDFFESMGCSVSDHGMDAVPFAPCEAKEAEAIFQKRLANESLSELEIRQFKTALLYELGKLYFEKGWVMQLHFGVIRDLSKRVFRALGPDAGIDSIGSSVSINDLAGFLNLLDEEGKLPKTILYSLNPNDNTAITTVMGAFQTSEACGKLQHGSAWWFNDHKEGMETQLKNLAAEGALAGFVGMLTDSRSFLSYARHEYFRRILCHVLGQWVEDGEFPADEKTLRQLVEGISYFNAKNYFGF